MVRCKRTTGTHARSPSYLRNSASTFTRSYRQAACWAKPARYPLYHRRTAEHVRNNPWKKAEKNRIPSKNDAFGPPEASGKEKNRQGSPSSFSIYFFRIIADTRYSATILTLPLPYHIDELRHLLISGKDEFQLLRLFKCLPILLLLHIKGNQSIPEISISGFTLN